MQVFCVLLLQNAGLKSKDVSARSMAIDFLGTIAARLKHDDLIFRQEKLWIVQELGGDDDVEANYSKDMCSVCLEGSMKSLFSCQSCERLLHADCMGAREDEVPSWSWNCQLCITKKQLMVLQSYCKPPQKESKRQKTSESFAAIAKIDIVQQLLLNHLQESTSADDEQLFIRWCDFI